MCCYVNNNSSYYSDSLSQISGCNFEKHAVMFCSILFKLWNGSGGSPINLRWPLYRAVARGFATVVTLLITNGCDMSLIEPNEKCTITLAVKQSDYNILKILLLCGADTSVLSLRDLMDPPRYAEGYFEDDRLFLVQWLQQPRSLKYFCRKTIRHIYGSMLPSALKTIRYPQYLKDYIRGKHLL